MVVDHVSISKVKKIHNLTKKNRPFDLLTKGRGLKKDTGRDKSQSYSPGFLAPEQLCFYTI